MEGIWYAHFTAGPVQGDGMAVLRNGEILGGDPVHTYKGSYQEEGQDLFVNVCVSPYAGSKLPVDMEHPLTFFLRGSIKGDSAHMQGHPSNHPDLVVSVEMQKGA